MSVISAVGTREYYRKFGYHQNGPVHDKGVKAKNMKTNGNILGKGTWIDKIAHDLISRENNLGRDTDLYELKVD